MPSTSDWVPGGQPGTSSSPSAQPIIHVANLHKRFGKTTVLADLSFDVYRGETFGLLGTNGSGKTTTLRCLLGIFPPDGGVAHIDGKPFDASMSHILGYLPEERGLYVKETPLTVMTYFGQLKGMSYHEARTWSGNYLDRVDLGDKANVKITKLSGGQQQKIQLGATIMNDPSLIILDEPTKGFDPINRRLLQSIINERQQAGATIVLITHAMAEVEELCDRVLLLKDGKAGAYGSVDEVRAAHGGYKARITHAQPFDIDLATIPAIQGLATMLSSNVPTNGHYESVVQLAHNEASQVVLPALVTSGMTVMAYVPFLTSMDDVFTTMYQTDGNVHA